MLVFNCIESLSLDHQFNYWGDAFNHNNISKISLKGRFVSNKFYDRSDDLQIGIAYVSEESGIWTPLYDPSSPYSEDLSSPVSGNMYFDSGFAYINFNAEPDSFNENSIISPIYDIFEGHSIIRDRFSDFQDIILNGVNIGKGRILSYDFGDNKTINKSNYSVSLEIYKDSCMDNWGGAGYENVSFPSGLLKHVRDLSENFDIVTNVDGTNEFSRSLSFGLIGSPDRNSLNDAKNLASGMMWGDPMFSAAIPDYSSFYENGYRQFQESYDLSNGRYSFSESVKSKGLTDYIWNHGLNLEVSENGESRISENGTILGIGFNKFSSAKSGFNAISTDRLSRANSFYSFYYGSGSCPANLSFLASDLKYDKCVGKIDYSFNYSDGIENDGCYIIESESSIQKNQNGLFSLQKRGSIRSTCSGTPTTKLSGSFEYFKSSVSGGIEEDLWSLYSGEQSGCPCDNLTLKQYTHEFDRFKGGFSYDYSYDVDCSSVSNDCFIGYSSIESNSPVHTMSVEYMPYYGEVAQKQNTSAMYSRSQNISVLGKCNSQIQDYFQFASGLISPPNSGTFFMSQLSYNFSPESSKFDMSLQYMVEGYREKEAYDV